MSGSINKIDVVGEYLREVDLRLSGLPLLQRHELLADLRAHIDTAREHGAYSDSEMIEVLQRLGSPEAIAAAAYWEAGPQPPRPGTAAAPAPVRRGGVPGWLIAMLAGIAVMFLLGFLGLLFFAQVSEGPAPAPAIADNPGKVPVQPAPLPTR
jgi:uncharacterized membrane protein